MITGRDIGQIDAAGGAAADTSFLVVGIGASAGGLEAFKALLAVLHPRAPMTFLVVQHLDPVHKSLLADLLVPHTDMPVAEAQDGMVLQAGHVYVIPPGSYMSVNQGALHLSQPGQGIRLPVDFLLRSMAVACGDRAAAVILSGNGADGSAGLIAVSDRRGLVIAQDPAEADYDGMPRHAIQTGRTAKIARLADIPALLEAFAESHSLGSGVPAPFAAGRAAEAKAPPAAALPPEPECLGDIITLLRDKTGNDFSLYKHGTLQRRIERRMALANIGSDGFSQYLQLLQTDPNEPALLASDLLINVTGFFRDAPVFDMLEQKIIPDLIASHSGSGALRFWIAGCSTGEEAYSIGMLLLEKLALAKSAIKVQIFASDRDADAIATARLGLYPEAACSGVSPDRLAQFFTREDGNCRIEPELRSTVIFTVQDVLTDPPFSRIDLVSCRNMLIYLSPEAQATVLSLFHFALRPGGILLLGNAESAGDITGRFEIISKPERLYRQIGRSQPGQLAFAPGQGELARLNLRGGQKPPVSRQNTLAELVRKMVLDRFAPVALLVNPKLECLYSLGPASRYLSLPEGAPTQDLLAMVPAGLHTKLRSAVRQAIASPEPATVEDARLAMPDGVRRFNIVATAVQNEGEELVLLCFIDLPAKPAAAGTALPAAGGTHQLEDLQAELDSTRTELHAAIQNLEISNEEQKAINEEALSVNEEYQSTNEELLASKEELQSLNEELSALNSQLQETLDSQRTTANDLQNVLYSLDVATLFLDLALNIRFFTPATKSLFHVIPGDVGRPLADLSLLSIDGDLLADARTVLRVHVPMEREIESRKGLWYLRRILPYRNHDGGVEGVVVTFTDITARKLIADALARAERQAQMANIAKSRFLAAASHDLRQPLQTLTLLQGLLAKAVESDNAKGLVMRFDKSLAAMTGMLNALLDINQIETGNVTADVTDFPVQALFDRLREEFILGAEAEGLELCVMHSSLRVTSDSRLLGQMIRNLLSNALKYTRKGKVLLGCKRQGKRVLITVADTGIGIPEAELKSIFDEYHQIGNPARERSLGLGLGLSIVQRLGGLLGHRVRVQSAPDKGSSFTIEVPRALQAEPEKPAVLPVPAAVQLQGLPAQRILLVEDDPEVRDLLSMFLNREGYDVMAAADGTEAEKLVAASRSFPDLVLADYNLPNGPNGLQLGKLIRQKAARKMPVIILTGDISTATLHDITAQACVKMNKPVKLQEISAMLLHLLAPAAHPAPAAARTKPAVADGSGNLAAELVYVVDDDPEIRLVIRAVLENAGYEAEDFGSCEAFLAAFRPGRGSCLLVDAYLPGMSGLDLLRRLQADGVHLPAIMITGNSDVATAVAAMKAGAMDFLEKPLSHADLLGSVERAAEQSAGSAKLDEWRSNAAKQVAGLTSRQHQIMEMVLAGHPSKNIAADLGISQRTVENHRAAIMKRTGSRSLPALARMALAAGGQGPGPSYEPV